MSLIYRSWVTTVALVLLLACSVAAGAESEEHYYAVEINDTLCGYAHILYAPSELDGRATMHLEERLFLMLSALGSEFNTDLVFDYQIDPATGQFLTHDSVIKQGRLEMDLAVRIEGDRAHVTSSLSAEETIELAPDVMRPNTLYFEFLRRDFADGKLESKTYPILEVRDAEVQETKYTRLENEEIELVGQRFETIVLDTLNLKTGIKLRIWLDRDSGQFLKARLPNSRLVYLTDPQVVKRIELVNLDENLTSGTNVLIPDIQDITQMKVRAVLEPSGLWITEESLNVPGQKFVGTVTDNRIEGVFEIEHPHYDGANAPPFPPEFGDDPDLAEFLEPGDLIESDDAVLVEYAEKLTRGSNDSWEAVQRISAWVAENISYAIPGGGTARKTFDMRAGECGSHSNLTAALSRAVGIPARVVWGCMYIPNFGGAFGQHGWNEVYMGEAGWIPLDATANETDFVDSGHIRVGVHESVATALNPVELEVLEHRLGSGEASAADATAYDAYLGEFTHETGRKMIMVVQGDSLAVDIPGQVVLALDEPDEKGEWHSKLAPHVFVTFERDDEGEVAAMKIHEVIRMQRTTDADEIADDVPDEMRPYLGKYLLAQLNAEFTVIYRDGGLAVDDPLNKKVVGLQPPDAEGRRLDEFGKNTIWFENDDEGRPQTLLVDSATRFER